ncbi:TetR/AcrR family transcriptional regulator [Furfurilactobacillus entadae]|uniref:TetR/AcrR family transcriptional regulator n=1 Tax=Furfurilactobacillus entadae TaxID=2922307 RepID=UPI0035E658D6
MEKISQQRILDTAQQLVEQNGIQKVTLTKVGQALGISHAALYKHFKNKEDLWTSLALSWLDKTLVTLFPFNTEPYTTKTAILHDWLWTLTSQKMAAREDDPDMFALYTTYIDQNPAALQIHVNDLDDSLQQAIGPLSSDLVTAVMNAFLTFSAPAYASSWGPSTQEQFESVWQLMLPGLKQALD